ncbi:MAG: tRNA 2-thiouridine(34) synthase MnmA [Ignavibacteria bacterium]|nr:tRNA 2-thiouridine(34) synthase MnmA [Ignavibacteria bacterium]
MDKKGKNIVVAMSGGVDSSVAAYILHKEGYNVIGITMKNWGYDGFPERDSGCCSLEMIYSARNVAVRLGFPHYTVDFTDKFNETVIEDFISEYLKGRTPNPCVLCNKVIKWGVLLEKARSLGANYLATGHYARVKYDESFNRYYVSCAYDKTKDQSYALWRLSQEALACTIFPLGDLNKKEVREIARTLKLKPADIPDSQEICFVPDDNYRELIQIRLPGFIQDIQGGDIVYKGKKVGKHKGYINYTIGQRRGLGLSLGRPLYVTKIDPRENVIYVDDEEGLYVKSFICKEVNLMKIDKITKINATVKIRYNDPGSEAFVEDIGDNKVKVTFIEPCKAVTPGQSAVFYKDDDVIGGGIIDEVLD